jgi:hypothetical protein
VPSGGLTQAVGGRAPRARERRALGRDAASLGGRSRCLSRDRRAAKRSPTRSTLPPRSGADGIEPNALPPPWRCSAASVLVERGRGRSRASAVAAAVCALHAGRASVALRARRGSRPVRARCLR